LNPQNNPLDERTAIHCLPAWAPAAREVSTPSPQAKKKPRHRARQFIREETPRKGEGVNRRLVP